MTFLARATLASPLLLLAAAPALAQETVETETHTLSVETVLDGLVHPWALAFISEEAFLVTERNTGTLRVGTVAGDLSDPIWEAGDLFRYEGPTPRSQAGMFDIQLHPDFDENGLAYVSYSRETDRGAAMAVVRGTVTRDGDAVEFAEVEDVFVMKEEDQDSSGLHFGGRMAFAPEGDALFLSIGERRNLERAQDASDQAGAVLRMTETGEPHGDNPTFATDEEEGESDPWLYAIGIRNIQALGVHPFTGELWSADHGPEGGDRIDLIEAGNNYGWPFITGGEDYSGAPLGVGLTMEGMISPVHVFDDTVSPSGLMFVPEGTAFTEWTGDMLIGGLVTEGIVRLRLEGGEVVQEEAIELGHRIRDIRLGPDDALWLITDEENGAVLRLTPQE